MALRRKGATVQHFDGEAHYWGLTPIEDKMAIRVTWNGCAYLFRFVYTRGSDALTVMDRLQESFGQRRDIEANYFPLSADVVVGGAVEGGELDAYHLLRI